MTGLVQDPDRAMRELEMVLEHDPDALTAFSLLKACERMLRRRAEAVQVAQQTALASAPASEDTSPASADAPLLSTDQLPDISLESLVPGREDLTEDLQSAGQNLQSIFRGLQSLLGDEETAAEDGPEESAPDAGEPPTGSGPGAPPASGTPGP